MEKIMAKETDIWTDGTLWKWIVGIAGAAALGWGVVSWTAEPVGVPADQASDPSAHTAPADKTPGEMTRDKLDPRSY
jgi:hypothetical protein